MHNYSKNNLINHSNETLNIIDNYNFRDTRNAVNPSLFLNSNDISLNVNDVYSMNLSLISNKSSTNNNCNCLKNVFSNIKSILSFNNINTNNNSNNIKNLIIKNKNNEKELREIANKLIQKIYIDNVNLNYFSVHKDSCKKTTNDANFIARNNHKFSVKLQNNTAKKIGYTKKPRKTSAELQNFKIIIY